MFNIFMVQEYDCRFKTLRHVSRLHVSYSPEIKENAFHRHCIRQQIISETIRVTRQHVEYATHQNYLI